VTLYEYALLAMAATAPCVFFVLLFISAPYGRYTRTGWGPGVSPRAGWMIMEAPASLLMFLVFYFSPLNTTVVVLLIVWQVHYFHRAFIYPLTLKSVRPMPVSVMLMAFAFNTINAGLNGYHFVLHADWYEAAWLWSPQFIAGIVLFSLGYLVTKRSDRILAGLRHTDDDNYKIPRGFLFRYVSCPNYLGEIIEWCGWALMTLSPAALVFVLWTIANLVPRALSHHRWYRQEFVDYPRERKALVPFVI